MPLAGVRLVVQGLVVHAPHQYGNASSPAFPPGDTALAQHTPHHTAACELVPTKCKHFAGPRSLQQLGLPLRDPVRAHDKLARQLRQSPLVADRRRRPFALNSAERLRRGRLLISGRAPVSRGSIMPLSGSDSTYPTVQISRAASVLVNPDPERFGACQLQLFCFLSLRQCQLAVSLNVMYEKGKDHPKKEPQDSAQCDIP